MELDADTGLAGLLFRKQSSNISESHQHILILDGVGSSLSSSISLGLVRPGKREDGDLEEGVAISGCQHML